MEYANMFVMENVILAIHLHLVFVLLVRRIELPHLIVTVLTVILMLLTIKNAWVFFILFKLNYIEYKKHKDVTTGYFMPDNNDITWNAYFLDGINFILWK